MSDQKKWSNISNYLYDKEIYNKAIDDFIEAVDREDRKEPLILDMFIIEKIAEQLKNKNLMR